MAARFAGALALAAVFLTNAGGASAQTTNCPPLSPPPPPGSPVESPWDELDASCIDSGDTALMMFATTFVMLQTPGMGLAQAGLIRRKNSLSMLMQIMTGLCVGSLLWYMFGYSLTFGPSEWSDGFIGDLSQSFFANVPANGCFRFAPSIPATVFAAFQMMFGLMVPMIVTGAFAEKITFEAFLIFAVLWPLLVYYPIAAWVWNPKGFLGTWGAFDFAGGITIHTPSGISSLVAASMMVRRKKNSHLGHHNLPLTIIGGVLIWSGWYSFNGGSAFAANGVAAQALLNTHIAACVSGLVWAVALYIKDGHWHLTEILSGALAGLAAVTPGSGFMQAWAAGIVGLIAGLSSRLGVWFVKDYMLIDDVLDVMSLQGIPGIVGSILAALFADPAINSFRTGVFYAKGETKDCAGAPAGMALLGVQTCSVLLSACWAAVMTFGIMTLIKHTVGIDIDHETEERGLDITQIGEQAYDQPLEELLDLGAEALAIKLCEAAANGDLTECERLVRAGAKPNGHDYDGRTPMHLAAAEGRLPVLQWLHQVQGVSISDVKFDNASHSPLADAIAGKRGKAVEYLIANGAKLGEKETVELLGEFMHAAATGKDDDIRRLLAGGMPPSTPDYDGRTALHVSAAGGNLGVVKLLIKHKADPSKVDRWGADAAMEASTHGHSKIATWIRQKGVTAGTGVGSDDDSSDGANQTGQKRNNASIRDLNDAAASGDLGEVQRALDRGGDPSAGDYDLRTALHVASAQGHLQVVQKLAKIKSVNVNAVDRMGNTALNDAVRNGHSHVAAWLRQNGAVISNRQQGYEACHLAHAGDVDALRRLIEAGVDASIADYDRRTALHIAASEGKINVIKYIISLGVNVAPTDRFGNTPFDDAIRHGQRQAARMLAKAMQYQNIATADDVRVPDTSDSDVVSDQSSSDSDEPRVPKKTSKKRSTTKASKTGKKK